MSECDEKLWCSRKPDRNKIQCKIAQILSEVLSNFPVYPCRDCRRGRMKYAALMLWFICASNIFLCFSPLWRNTVEIVLPPAAVSWFDWRRGRGSGFDIGIHRVWQKPPVCRSTDGEPPAGARITSCALESGVNRCTRQRRHNVQSLSL